MMNKSTGAHEISLNVIKNCFGELSDILRYVFDLSFQTGILADPLKTAKGTPVFKTGDLKEISNYRPISVLSCFSKILERTVKPPNSGHLRVLKKVSVIRRCPLYRGFSKNRNFVRFWLLYSI